MEQLHGFPKLGSAWPGFFSTYQMSVWRRPAQALTVVLTCCSVPSWPFTRQGCQRQRLSKAKIACSCHVGDRWRALACGAAGCRSRSIASKQSQHTLTPAIWAAEQPDLWQGCRILEPPPAKAAQRVLVQKPTHSQPSQNALEPKASSIKNDSKRSNQCFSLPWPNRRDHLLPLHCECTRARYIERFSAECHHAICQFWPTSHRAPIPSLVNAARSQTTCLRECHARILASCVW